MIPTAIPSRALAAVMLAVTALAVVASCPARLPLFGGLTPAAQASTPPPASPRPGYFAQTVCSEGEETIVPEDWFSHSDVNYPQMSGHLDTCNEPGGAMTLRDEGALDSEPGSGPNYVYQAPLGSLIAGGVAKIAMTSPGGEASFAVERQKRAGKSSQAAPNRAAASTTRQSLSPTPSGGL